MGSVDTDLIFYKDQRHYLQPRLADTVMVLINTRSAAYTMLEKREAKTKLVASSQQSVLRLI